jgi:hypothetical protein
MSFENILVDEGDICLIESATSYLRIRFDPKISGLKYNAQEAIINTLGGQYPIVRRNGR